MTVADALRLALTLPDAEKGTIYGSPAVKTGGQMFACKTTHKSAEPNTLAVRIDFAERDELIAADPATYYLKPHYENYPVVLVRLSNVRQDALRDLLIGAHRLVRAKRTSQKTARRARSSAKNARELALRTLAQNPREPT